MTIFVELTTSPIEQQFKRAAEKIVGEASGRSSRAGRTRARRPTRGLEVKDDTYATLKVIRANGQSIPLLDSGSKDGENVDGYTNFILQSVSESRMEKHQIIETFGASYVFFFGESPRFLDVTAQLLNSHDFNWEAEWWANYNTYLRGTKLVEMGARCYISYDDSVVEGYMMHANAVKTADQPFLVQLQFRFFVTNCYNVSQIGDDNFPVRYSAIVPDNISLSAGDAGRQIISNLQGGPLASALGTALSGAAIAAQALSQSNSLGSARSITGLVRSMPPSFAVSADWFALLEGRPDLQRLVYRDGRPIRSKISDNEDEYVGTPITGYGIANYEGQVTVRSTQNPTDLFWKAVEVLSCYGVNINNPDAFSALGLAANFSLGGVGASFNAQINAAFGFSASTGVGIGAVVGPGRAVGGVNDGASSSNFSDSAYTSGTRIDSLGVVYGRAGSRTSRFSSATQKIQEAGFDYGYGYESDYTTGPGYGKAGYGDYGGNGFGSSNRLGDPGYRSPDSFTFAGVADERSAFERFLRRREDRTALTPGARVGQTDLIGGASVAVGGNLSAFALVSVAGVLDATGGARSSPQYQSDQRVARDAGYGDMFTGVGCPPVGEAEEILSGGLVFNSGATTGVPLGEPRSSGIGFGGGAGAGLGGGIGVGI